MADPYTLYSMQNSGNCYKPRLILRLLGLPFRLVDTDPMAGDTRTPAPLALNPLLASAAPASPLTVRVCETVRSRGDLPFCTHSFFLQRRRRVVVQCAPVGRMVWSQASLENRQRSQESAL